VKEYFPSQSDWDVTVLEFYLKPASKRVVKLLKAFSPPPPPQPNLMASFIGLPFTQANFVVSIETQANLTDFSGNLQTIHGFS